MKKGRKFASVLVAALFATSPLISLTSNYNVQAAAGQKAVSTMDVRNHFLSGVKAYENGKPVNANVFLNNPKVLKNNSLIELSADNKLIDGRYEVQAAVTVTGFTPANQDRVFNLVDSFGNIVGSASIPANSSIATGAAGFEFTLSNGKMGPSSLGTVAKTKKPTKKTDKKRKKKTGNKKRRKSNKKTKKTSKRNRKSRKG